MVKQGVEIDRVIAGFKKKDLSLHDIKGMIQGLMETSDGESHAEILSSIVQDRALHSLARAQAVSMLSECEPEDSVEITRQVLHNREECRAVRSQALHSLFEQGGTLLHIDLAAILADPSEPDWLRGEAARMAGSFGLSSKLSGVLKFLLNTSELPSEVVFWCLYACHQIDDDPEIKDILDSYLGEQRLIGITYDNEKDVPSVHAEAQWILDLIEESQCDD